MLPFFTSPSPGCRVSLKNVSRIMSDVWGNDEKCSLRRRASGFVSQTRGVSWVIDGNALSENGKPS